MSSEVRGNCLRCVGGSGLSGRELGCQIECQIGCQIACQIGCQNICQIECFGGGSLQESKLGFFQD